MQRWFQQTLVAGVVALSAFGAIGTASASAASPSQGHTISAPAADPYIYGYYQLYGDCDVVGFAGVMNGAWRGYVCDSRYVSGYYALVVVP
ncbi:hypothetical protein [Streptomyces sp. NPDC059009]|uniref:hypothetical protein n=1 Tax=Streptomyces sp. NPDC059009 TaxID=3346694 RepID=UPI003683C950